MNNALEQLKDINDYVSDLYAYLPPRREMKYFSQSNHKPLRKTDPKKWKKRQAQKAARKKARK